jgi:hypothetical protein
MSSRHESVEDSGEPGKNDRPRLYGEPPRLGLLNHKRGHTLPADVEPRLLEWLETYV